MTELQDFQMSINNIMSMLNNPNQKDSRGHEHTKEENAYKIPDGTVKTFKETTSDSDKGWASKSESQTSVMHQHKDSFHTSKGADKHQTTVAVGSSSSKGHSMASQSAVSSSSKKASISLSKVCTAHKGLSLDAAIKGNYINARTGMFTDMAGKNYTLSEAMSKDLINRDSAVFINPQNQSMMTLLDAIERGHVQRTGHHFDPKTCRKVTLEELMASSGVVTRETEYQDEPVDEEYRIEAIVDPISQRKMAVTEAISQGIFNPEEGRLYNTKTGKLLSVKEAVEQGFIITSCEVSDSVASPSAQLVKTTKAFNITGAIHPVLKHKITLSEAISEGIVDRDHGLYNNWATGEKLRIQEAILKGLVIGSESSHQGDDNAIISHRESTYTLMSVCHPTSREKLSVAKAIHLGILDTGNGVYHCIDDGTQMPLNDAIEKGLVQVRRGMHAKEKREQKVSSLHIEDEEEETWTVTEEVLTETKKWVVTSVLDPTTGKMISYNDALLQDILNQVEGVYQNCDTGEKMAIAQAIEKGFIVGELVSVNVDEDLFEQFTATAEHIESVVHPKTKQKLSFDQAVSQGLIDKATHQFIDPTTKKSMSVSAAAQKGLLVKRKSEMDMHAHPNRGQHKALDSDNVFVGVDVTGFSGSSSEKPIKSKENGFLNKEIHSKVQNILNRTQMYTKESAISDTKHHVDQYKTDWEKECVYDLRTGQSIPMDQAISMGVVDAQQAKLMQNFYKQVTPNGVHAQGKGITQLTHSTVSSTNKASSSGHLDAYEQRIRKGEALHQHAAQSGQSGGQDAYSMTVQLSQTIMSDSKIGVLTYNQAVRLGLFNIKMGRFLDSVSGVHYSLQDAVSKGFVHPNGDAFKNLNTGATFTLSEAISKGFIDADMGRVLENKIRGSNVAVEDCFCTSRLVTLPPLNFEDAIKCGLFNPVLNRFTHPQSVDEQTLGEAVYMKCIDGKSVVVQDPSTGLRYYLDTALKKRIIHPETGNIQNPETGETVMSLLDALKGQLFESTFDPVTFTVLDPNTGARVEVAQAIKRNLLGTDTCLAYDPDQCRQVPVDEAIRKEIIDRQMGMYKDSHGGRRLLAKTATEMGLIAPLGAPLLYKVKLSEAISRLYTFGQDSISAPQYTVHHIKQQLDKSHLAPVPATKKTVEVQDFMSEKTVRLDTPKFPTKPAIEVCPNDKVIPARPYNFQCKPPAPPPQKPDDQTDALDELLQFYKTKKESKPPKAPSNPDGISNPEFHIKGGDYDFLKLIEEDHHEIDTFVPHVHTPAPKKVEWEFNLVHPQAQQPSTVTEVTKEMTVTQDVHNKHPIRIKSREKSPPRKHSPQRITDKEIIIIEKEAPEPPQVKIVSVTIYEALENRFIDLSKKTFTSPVTGVTMSLSEAISLGCISGNLEEIKKAILDYHARHLKCTTMEYTTIQEFSSVVEKKSDKLSLADAMEMNYLDPCVGRFIAPKSGNVYTMKEAVERGLVDGKSAHVVNPADNKVYDLTEAFYKGILNDHGFFVSPGSGKRKPFEEAFRRGYVTVTKSGGTINKVTTIKEVKRVSVSFVIDPSTTAQIDLQSAINQGILIPGEGLYRNPCTRDAMPIDDAMKLGLIKGEILDSKRSTDERIVDSLSIVSHRTQQPRMDDDGKEEVNVRVVRDPTKTFMIQFVTDPRTNRPISPTEAIKVGIIDLSKAEYINIVSKEVITFEEAIRRKLMVCVDTTLIPKDVRFNILSVTDPRNNWEIPLSQAIINKIINFEKGLYVNIVTGASMSIAEAIQKGLIKAEGHVPKGLTSPKKHTVKQEELEDFTDSVFVQTQTYTITHAIDTRTRDMISITEALKRGILDEALSVYHDLKSGEEITIQDAIDQKKLIARLEDPSKVQKDKSQRAEVNVWVDEPKDSRKLRRTTIYDIDVVIDPETKKEIPLKEAMHRGIVNRKTGEYGDGVSIQQAIDEGLLRAKPLPAHETSSVSLAYVIDPRTREKMSVSDALRHGLVDRSKQAYVFPQTGERIPLRDAVRQGLAVLKATDDKSGLPTSSTFWSSKTHYSTNQTGSAGNTLGSSTRALAISSVVDPKTGQDLSVPAALKQGILGRSRRTYINQVTGEVLSLHEAIKKGLVKLSSGNEVPVEPTEGHVLSGQCTFSEAMDRGLINAQTQMFLHPGSGQIYSVKEAIQLGFIVDEGDRKHLESTKRHGHAEQLLTQTTTETKSVRKVAKTPTSPSRPVGQVGNELGCWDGPITLKQAMDQSYINMLTGEVTMPHLKQPVCIDDALVSGAIILPVPLPATMPRTHGPHPLSLTDAFRQGLVNPISLDIRVAEGNKWISLEEALHTGYIQVCPTNQQIGLIDITTPPSPSVMPHFLVTQDTYNRQKDNVTLQRSNSVPRDAWKVKEVVTKPTPSLQRNGNIRSASFRGQRSLTPLVLHQHQQNQSNTLRNYGTTSRSGTLMNQRSGQQSGWQNSMNRQGSLHQSNTLNSRKPGGTLPTAIRSPICHFVNGKLYASRQGYFIDKNGNVINTTNDNKMSLKQALMNNIVQEIQGSEEEDGSVHHMDAYRPWGMDYMLRRYMGQQQPYTYGSTSGFDAPSPFPHVPNTSSPFFPYPAPPSSRMAFSDTQHSFFEGGHR